jgi:hypothetical protein|tara:strand:+ start:812 stop:1249 length:438 start_codon:yes stop_codon:yes gene_type:complete
MKNQVIFHESLKRMGFKKIGKFFIKNKQFIVECGDEFLLLKKMIYIHTIDDEILRVGTSKKELKTRMREWERDVTKSLNNQKSNCPISEGKKWNELLTNKIGILYGRQGTIVKTPVGEINTYLSEESYLIRKYRPKMNRDLPRHL